MSGRLSISTKDLHRLLDVTSFDNLAEPGSPLPWSVLHGLAEFFGCDNVTFESSDVAAHSVVPNQALTGVDSGCDFGDPAVRSSFWTQYWRGLCDYSPRTGDVASARRMLCEPEWLTCASTPYGEWIRGIGVRGEVTLALPPHDGKQYRILLWRFNGRDFSERDCMLLTLIYPRLAALHAAVLRRQERLVDLTPRQWQLMHLIAAGNTNRQIATRLGLSEGTVRTHCEHIFERLHVTNRVAAVAKAFPPEVPSTTPAEFVTQGAVPSDG